MRIKPPTTGQKIANEIEQLRAERDEARRKVCVWQGLDTGNTPRETAAVRGWDCYKENFKDLL
jgi:hypothetical protein